MPGGDAERLADYERGCADGTYQLLAVLADDRRAGSLLFEVVKEPAGPVVIIHALRCDPVAGVPVADLTTLTFAKRCRAQGVTLLRCFTERAGLVRRMKKLGASACWQLELPL